MENRGLCCFCGQMFINQKDCEQHELEEHSDDPLQDTCFHQNYLDSEDCLKCNPHLAMDDENFADFIDPTCGRNHTDKEHIFHCETCSPTWPYCHLCFEYFPFK